MPGAGKKIIQTVTSKTAFDPARTPQYFCKGALDFSALCRMIKLAQRDWGARLLSPRQGEGKLRALPAASTDGEGAAVAADNIRHDCQTYTLSGYTAIEALTTL